MKCRMFGSNICTGIGSSSVSLQLSYQSLPIRYHGIEYIVVHPTMMHDPQHSVMYFPVFWFNFQYHHDDVIKWKHFPRYWLFVWEIDRWPVNSPHKGQWRGALMFSLMCVWINGWVNNRKAGDLRRHRGHYDVIFLDILNISGTGVDLTAFRMAMAMLGRFTNAIPGAIMVVYCRELVPTTVR